MLISHPFQRRKFVPFAEGTVKADEDKKRFNIRDQNEILKDFLEEHKDAAEELLDGDIDEISPVTKVFLSGRVRIEVPILPEEAVPDLTCEECEKDPAVAKCEECNEVFCEKCLELCHEKNWTLNVLHAHYKSNSIRELQVGDTSKVDLSRPYVLPEYECYDTDCDLVRNRDISQPYSLTVPTTLRHHKMTTPLIQPKYNVGDTVLYLDFQSTTPEDPVFGVIISEWDFRHGDCAPTITRGPDSVLWYVIRRLDEVPFYDPYAEDGEEGEGTMMQKANERSVSMSPGRSGRGAEQASMDESDSYTTITDTSALTTPSVLHSRDTQRSPKPRHKANKPLIDGFEDVPLRHAMVMAKEVNKRAKLAKQIRTFGSKLHFSSLFTAKPKGGNSADTVSTMTYQDDVSILSNDLAGNHSLSDETAVLSKHQWHMLKARPEAEEANETLDEHSMTMMSDVMGNNTGPKMLKGVSDTYVVMAGLKEKGVDTLTANGKLLPASKRSYYHVYEDNDDRFEALDRSGSWDWRTVSSQRDVDTVNSVVARDMQKILVMPENEIHDPKDYFKKLLSQKQSQFKGIVKRAFVKMFAAQLQNAFETWHDLMFEQIFKEETIAATKIATAARRWLCRNVLRDIREEIQRELERRRAILHRSMRYSTKGPGQSTKDGPKPPLFTMDNKRFFDTRRDMNRYALHLRVEISKVIYFLNIRRCAILSEALGRWRATLQEAFLESDLKGGHILPYSDNEYRSNSGHGFDEMKNTWREAITAEMTMEEYREDVRRLHSQINNAFEADMNSRMIAITDESLAKTSPHKSSARTTLGRGPPDSHFNILAVPLRVPQHGADLEGEEEIHSPFHPTVALRVKPKDLTTGCAGGYSTSREGELIFSNDDHGASSASKETNCVTIDTSFSTKTAKGSISRIGRDGEVSRINPKDNVLLQTVTADLPRVGSRKPKATVAESPPGSQLLSVLPPLPVVPVSQGEDGNLAFTSENKTKYNSLRQRLEGPTENSCWIIPGLLAMGTVPVGRAWRRRHVKTSVHTRIDAASQLVLSGISTFVSLLPQADEAIAEKRCSTSLELPRERGGFGIDAGAVEKGCVVENCYKDTVSGSRFELKNVISSLKSKIENWNADIQLNVVDDPLDMRYGDSLKEDLRLRARRAIDIECSDVAKKELAQLPDTKRVTSEFVRMPIQQDSAPDLNDFLPLLWKLEKRLMAGERLYIYSLEGHGRCGLVCGCLLGRLYGLTPRETLFRMQVYHDFIPSQVHRVVPINCPQLINQQELLVSVLNNTNRVFDGVTLRSQLDPETYQSELIHLERGSQVGVYGVAVSAYKETRTVPTVYHEAGGKSKATWVDCGKKSFEELVDEHNVNIPIPQSPISRRFTQSSGGYTKKGLSLRNSRSTEEDAMKNGETTSPTFSATMPSELDARKAPRRSVLKKKKPKRRATTGEFSSGSDSERDEIKELKKLQATLKVQKDKLAINENNNSITLPNANPDKGLLGTKPPAMHNKIKSIRPAPAEGPKLPSIRSRYGDLA